MKKYFKLLFVLVFLLCITKVSISQVKSFSEIETALRDEVKTVNGSRSILSERGFNNFMQKKVTFYLTGAGDLSIYQTFATYSSDNDRFIFGVNIPKLNDKGRLVSLFTPMFESNIKNSFATLYKKGEWQSDIRAGFKYTYIPAKGTVNYYPAFTGKNKAAPGQQNTQQFRMIGKRIEILNTLIKKLKKEEADITKQRTEVVPYITESVSQINSVGKQVQETDVNKIAAAIIPDPDFPKKLIEYEKELAKLEAEAMEVKDAYTWSKLYWFSFWGFAPLTSRDYYTTPDATQSFEKRKFKTWEFNAQANILFDGLLNGSSIFLSATGKIFNNNSALADLMTNVDYDKYQQLPGANPLNFAKLETNKAYLGGFDEFTTQNINLLFVLTGPWKNSLINPGISFRYEKNWGDYSAVNLRLGFPLKFRGKEKPVNIEPQVRWNNVTNFSNKVDYKVQPVFGINIGLPFTPLFK